MLTDEQLSAIRARCEATKRLFGRFQSLEKSVADIPALLAHIDEQKAALAKADGGSIEKLHELIHGTRHREDSICQKS